MAATLRSAVPADAEAIAQILIDVRCAFMPYAPLVHSAEEVHSWVAGVLVPSGNTVIAESSGDLIGVLASAQAPSCSWIDQMAVHPSHVGPWNWISPARSRVPRPFLADPALYLPREHRCPPIL